MKAAFYDRGLPAMSFNWAKCPILCLLRARCGSASSGSASTRPMSTPSVLARRHHAVPRVIPHSDGMGAIDAAGPGLRSSAARVSESGPGTRPGLPARHRVRVVCLPQNQAVRAARWRGRRGGACLGIPALTALHAVLMDGGVAGKTVFVAAVRAVGHYAVQMASQLGAARVLTSVSTPRRPRWRARRAPTRW